MNLITGRPLTHNYCWLLLFFLLLPAKGVGAVYTLETVGGWTLTEGPARISQAGDNLATAESSPISATLIKVGVDQGDPAWMITIRRSDLDWPAGVILAVRRTGTNTPPTVSGGRLYQQIDTLDNYFLQGNGDCDNIYLQYQLSGLSAIIGTGNYSTQVIFTISAY